MDQIKMLKVADVVPTEDNPRHINPNDPKVKELAASIRASGLLCPVICRPHPKLKGKFDLRAGFRRLLAHKELGAPEIMAIVRDLDDRQAMEVTVLENLQRENLTPLEEARGVAALLGSGHAIADISAEIGKSAAWVYRRASLTKLIPDLVKLVESGHRVWGHATAAHLEVLARLPETRQATFVKNTYFQMPQTAGALAQQLEREEMLIRSAPWDLDDMTLGEPFRCACSACTARSDVQPELFGDETDPAAIAKRARCLDPECWRQKRGAYLRRTEAELRKKHGDKLAVVGNCELEGRGAPIRRTHDSWSVDKVKEKTPGARPALWVEDGTAKECWVKVKPGRDGKEAKPKAPPLEMRRKAWVIKYVEKALTAKDAECPLKSLAQAGAMAALFGTWESAQYVGDVTGIWKKAEELKHNGEALARALWTQVRPILKRRLSYMTVSECGRQFEEAVHQAALLGLGDEAALMKMAEGAVKGVAGTKRK